MVWTLLFNGKRFIIKLMSQKGFISTTLIILFIVLAFVMGLYLGISKYQDIYLLKKRILPPANNSFNSTKNDTVINSSKSISKAQPATLKFLELDIRWTDDRDYRQTNGIFINNYGYVKGVLQQAYIVPSSAASNIPPYLLTNEEVKNSTAFLVLHSNFRDIRTADADRMISGDYYYRIRRDKQDVSPVYGSVRLSPQENGDVDVVFPINKEETKFQILVGPFNKANLINIDFSSTKVKGIIGVFDWDKGFTVNSN